MSTEAKAALERIVEAEAKLVFAWNPGDPTMYVDEQHEFNLCIATTDFAAILAEFERLEKENKILKGELNSEGEAFDSPSAIAALSELREMSKGVWDDVDPGEFVREQRN